MRKARLLWCLSILLIALLVVSVVAVLLTTQQVDDDGKLRLEWQQVLPGIEGWAIIQTSDGGYLVLGESASIIVRNDTIDYDAEFENYVNILVKTDSEGNILWQKDLCQSNGRAKDYFFYRIIETNDGGYTLGATFHNSSGSDIVDQFYIIKIDAEGNTLWNRTYAGPTINTDVKGVSFNDILQLNDGSYIIIGTYQANFYHAGTYYLKVDSSGKLQLNTTLGLGYPFSILSASDDAFAIMTGVYGRGGGSYFNLAKVDLNGTVIWKNKYFEENSVSSYGTCGTQTSEGGFVLCARLVGGFRDGDDWVVKTDSQGNMLWNRTYAEARSIDSVGQTSDGGVIFGGRAKDGNLTDYGEGKVWIAKADALGNIEAQIKTGGPVLNNMFSYTNEILQVSDGGYVCVGTLNETYTASPDQTFWIAKFSSR